MKGLKLPAVHDMHPNVTPLIDIVMCLIIFYMLVARIGVNVGDIPMNLPYSQWGTTIEDLGNTVTLNLEPNVVHGLSRDGKTIETFKVPESEANTIEARMNPSEGLKKFLMAYREANPNIKVILRGDQNLTYQHIEPVLAVITLANIKSYNLATRTERLLRLSHETEIRTESPL